MNDDTVSEKEVVAFLAGATDEATAKRVSTALQDPASPASLFLDRWNHSFQSDRLWPQAIGRSTSDESMNGTSSTNVRDTLSNLKTTVSRLILENRSISTAFVIAALLMSGVLAGMLIDSLRNESELQYANQQLVDSVHRLEEMPKDIQIAEQPKLSAKASGRVSPSLAAVLRSKKYDEFYSEIENWLVRKRTESHEHSAELTARLLSAIDTCQELSLAIEQPDVTLPQADRRLLCQLSRTFTDGFRDLYDASRVPLVDKSRVRDDYERQYAELIELVHRFKKS